VKELIEVRNAEINARKNNGRTALREARNSDEADTAAYLVSHGAIDDNDDDDDDDDAPLALVGFADGE
jgi:ankyrin repeat protein